MSVNSLEPPVLTRPILCGLCAGAAHPAHSLSTHHAHQPLSGLALDRGERQLRQAARAVLPAGAGRAPAEHAGIGLRPGSHVQHGPGGRREAGWRAGPGLQHGGSAVRHLLHGGRPGCRRLRGRGLCRHRHGRRGGGRVVP